MTITTELADILGDVRRPGTYFVAGRTEFLAPRLEVEGLGAIALPLLPSSGQAVDQSRDTSTVWTRIRYDHRYQSTPHVADRSRSRPHRR